MVFDVQEFFRPSRGISRGFLTGGGWDFFLSAAFFVRSFIRLPGYRKPDEATDKKRSRQKEIPSTLSQKTQEGGAGTAAFVRAVGTYDFAVWIGSMSPASTIEDMRMPKVNGKSSGKVTWQSEFNVV